MRIQIIEWAHNTDGSIATHKLSFIQGGIEIGFQLEKSELKDLKAQVEIALREYERESQEYKNIK